MTLAGKGLEQLHDVDFALTQSRRIVHHRATRDPR
jgi:hypothetical protein